MLKMTILIMYFLLGVKAQAADSTFQLSGIVVSSIKIQVNAIPTSSVVNTNSNDDHVVASVRELSNLGNNYDVTISSMNGKNVKMNSVSSGMSYIKTGKEINGTYSDTIKLTYTAK